MQYAVLVIENWAKLVQLNGNEEKNISYFISTS
jgi:hypothetical protein